MLQHEWILRTFAKWNKPISHTHTHTKSKYYRISLLWGSYSVSQSCPTLWPHRLQHARPPCLPPSSKVYPSSCPLHQWCHPAISSSDIPFSFCPQSFPTSGTLPMSWLYRIVFGCTRWLKYWSFSFSINPSKEYSGLISTKIDWFDLQGTSGVFSSITVQRHRFFGILPSLKQNSRAHQSVQ